jgi:outer membrane protein assembly factor BamB
MEPRFIRSLVVLGVPGAALGVMYLLLRRFNFQFSTVDPTWTAIIVILFLVIVGGITWYALHNWAPARKGSEITETDHQAAVPGRQLPNLSEEAKRLLIEASADADGVVMRTVTLGARAIHTNGKLLSEDGNPRAEAKWEAAIKALQRYDLFTQRDSKGQVYAVTDEGYNVAERLKQ